MMASYKELHVPRRPSFVVALGDFDAITINIRACSRLLYFWRKPQTSPVGLGRARVRPGQGKKARECHGELILAATC